MNTPIEQVKDELVAKFDKHLSKSAPSMNKFEKAAALNHLRAALNTLEQAVRKEAIEKTVECFTTHDEGFGDYCDTGDDMVWACRSDCVEHGRKRARRYYQSITT